MPTLRLASPADAALVATIAAEGFYDDPVLAWALPNDATRLTQLAALFRLNANDMVAGAGRIDLADDASAALWREPGHDHHAPDDPEAPGLGELGPFSPDEVARFATMSAAMHAAHPREAHWYLNVLSTRPSHQSQGLGAAVLQPVLALADAAGVPCYLESTNPRNRTLYRRQGFVDREEILLEGGPSMLQMWRDPR